MINKKHRCGLFLSVVFLASCATPTSPNSVIDVTRELPENLAAEIEVFRITYPVGMENSDVFTERSVRNIVRQFDFLPESAQVAFSSGLEKNINYIDLGATIFFKPNSAEEITCRVSTNDEWGKTLSCSFIVTDVGVGDYLLAYFAYMNASAMQVVYTFSAEGALVGQLNDKTESNLLYDAGYVYTGEEIDESLVSRIVENMTSMEQVRELMGMPREIALLTDGSEVHTYYFKQFGRSKWNLINPASAFVDNKVRREQMLEIRFVGGVVINSNYFSCDRDCS